MFFEMAEMASYLIHVSRVIMQDEGLCIICMEAPINAALSPCGHGSSLIHSRAIRFLVQQADTDFGSGQETCATSAQMRYASLIFAHLASFIDPSYITECRHAGHEKKRVLPDVQVSD